VEEFLTNLKQVFSVRVNSAEKVFKVIGQRSKSWPNQLTHNGGGIHFNETGRNSRYKYCYKVSMTLWFIYLFTYLLPPMHFCTSGGSFSLLQAISNQVYCVNSTTM